MVKYSLDEFKTVVENECKKQWNISGIVEKWSIEKEYNQMVYHYDHYVKLMATLCGHRNNDNWKKWFHDVAKPYIETKYKNSFIENRLNELENDFDK